MKLLGTISELVKVILRKSNYEVTVQPSTVTADTTFELPAAGGGTKAIVTADSSATLTNKIIDSDNNTITNIVNADIKAGAAIDPTKIADGSVTDTEFQYINSLTANVQTALDAKALKGANSDITSLSGLTTALSTAQGGTGVNSTATFPSTGTVVTRDSTDTLLNKTTISSTALATGALTLPVGVDGLRPASAAIGMVRFNTTGTTFEGYDGTTWSGIGGGGTTDRVTQATHGFVVGDVLYLNGATYTKARADAANTAEVVGMVSRVIDANTFEITLSGEVSGLTGLTAGEVYFLSPITAGATTTTEPSVVGQVSLPVGIASSTTTMYVQPKRGVLVGATNIRTQIALANNATTTVQNVSAYDAGELSGSVVIAATTSLRFFVSAQFSRNGAGTNYNVSYQASGDTPPVGFQITITSAGLLQVVMPSVAGFTSAAITYGLDVAAVGATLPLSINPSIITVVDTATEYSGNTKLGLMQYVAGTNYSGGISPTVTGTNWSTVRATFVPYQMADGTWRLRFNIQGNFSVATVATSLSVNGLTVKASINQAVAGFHSDGVDTWVKGQANGTANTISVYAGAARTSFCLSSDIELNSKPTWAY